MTPEQYLATLDTRYRAGNATEHTFRGDLQTLLESLLPGVQVTNEPKRQKCGAPDYILTRGDAPVGFIEAKDIGDGDLEGVRKTGNKEQLDRYRASLGNLLITDYLRFLWYRDGALVQQVAIGKAVGGRLRPDPAQKDVFLGLVREFATQKPVSIRSPKRLAELMAAKARLMADVIGQALSADLNTNQQSSLVDQLNGFKEILIHDITPRAFADVYAQTIAYGLFAARLHDPTLPTFSRAEAAELIPRSNPFLRKLFGYIAGPDIDDRIKWIVDNLVEVFLACNVEELLKDYGKVTQTEDPIIHFYETFLSEYDPALRKARGVWYTPAPVVKFIVRAVDDILKTEFGLKEGLADTGKTRIKVKTAGKATADMKSRIKEVEVEQEVHCVQILDPATGTGTFLAEVVKQVHAKFKGMQGVWSNYVKKDLIPRLKGFELLMASYAMAHLQLDLLLKDTGFATATDRRLRVFLTNSLEEHHPDTGTLFANWLATEANEANRIKRDTPVMCVIGNPPYSGESANKGGWIMKLMEDYKREPGEKRKLQEKNPKWINADENKFIRLAQHLIDKNGFGILAFINPHGFAANPTFRGMRWSLMNSFDKIYILDLHGNSNRKETAPDGSADENVFDIMQGVSVNIFVKASEKKANEPAKVFRADVYGKRQAKYDFLSVKQIDGIAFTEPAPSAPNYYFKDNDIETSRKYDEGFSISTFFRTGNVGIVTARDHFSVHFSQEEVKDTIDTFLALDDETARARFELGSDVRDWQVVLAKNDLARNYPGNGLFCKISYRPFDARWTYFTGNSKGFHCYPREETMKHFLLGDNFGLVTARSNKSGSCDHFYLSKHIMEAKCGERTTQSAIFPLYVYQNKCQLALAERPQRTLNLDESVVARIAIALNHHFIPDHQLPHEVPEGYTGAFTPLDLLDYVYAVLHHPGYRETYKEFLKIDFPRVPYPKDAGTFWRLAGFGSTLRGLHLLEAPVLDSSDVEYPAAGDNVVEKVRFELYDRAPGLPGEPLPDYKGSVYINHTQYFSGVSQHAWEFYVGGYQPAQKWLKDRKGCILGWEDIRHYGRIIGALSETRGCMEAIGEVDLA